MNQGYVVRQEIGNENDSDNVNKKEDTGSHSDSDAEADDHKMHQRKRPRVEGAAEPNSGNISDEEIVCPIYIPSMLASTAFNNLYFYVNEKRVKDCIGERQEKLGSLTVLEVYLKFQGKEKAVEFALTQLAAAIGAIPDRVIEYYASADITVEAILASKRLIALNSLVEIDNFHQRAVANVPTMDEIWYKTYHQKNREGKLSRAIPIGLVVGSSGSGKTFFAIQHLGPNFLMENKGDNDQRVTLYFHANRTGVQFLREGKQNPDAAEQLCTWIRRKTASIALREEKMMERQLKMHVCLIIDEAGDLAVKSWFEDKAMLCKLCDEAAKLATSVAVVVAGTGLTGREMSSVDDAYVFRMKSWQKKDFFKILNKQRMLFSEGESLPRTGDEIVNKVADSIFAKPKLAALATNGRSAYFLVDALSQLSLKYTHKVWSLQLDAWAPYLVTQVVQDYIVSNGIKGMSAQERRLIAASVFFLLRKSQRGVKIPLEFPGLQGKEVTVAMSLVHYNVETDGDMNYIFLQNEEYAVTVTPAIAIVLYAMAGVPTTFGSGWKAEEELAALYACRQLMLKCMKTFVDESAAMGRVGKKPAQVPCEALNKLSRSLGEICVFSLPKQVKPKPDKFDRILLPIVGRSSVMLNGDMAPFADVIAPQALIQAKLRRKPELKMNLQEELLKCCLLKGDDVDTRLLRGLVAIWKGDLEVALNPETHALGGEERTNRNTQDSAAFPENLLRFVPRRDQPKYAVIKGEKITTGNSKLSLPSLSGTTIDFIVATNVHKIKLELNPDNEIVITGDNLNHDMEINVDTLCNLDRLLWEDFLTKIRGEVKIKFLMTYSE